MLVLTGRPSGWEVWGGSWKIERGEGREFVWLHMGVIGVCVDFGEEEVGVGLDWGEEGRRIHDSPGGRRGMMGNDTVVVPGQGRWIDGSELWSGLHLQGFVPWVRRPQLGGFATEEKGHTLLD